MIRAQERAIEEGLETEPWSPTVVMKGGARRRKEEMVDPSSVFRERGRGQLAVGERESERGIH